MTTYNEILVIYTQTYSTYICVRLCRDYYMVAFIYFKITIGTCWETPQCKYD